MSKSTTFNIKDHDALIIGKKSAPSLDMQTNLLDGLQISEELFDELLDLTRELSLLKLSEDSKNY